MNLFDLCCKNLCKEESAERDKEGGSERGREWEKERKS